MKKLLALLTVGAMLVPAVMAGTYFDKTNLDQLNFRTLSAGQVGWIEEDGGATIYVGSPTESKTLRVFDPAALRGYRYKSIDKDLVFSAENMVSLADNNGSFKYTSSNSDVLLYDYSACGEDRTADGKSEYFRQSGDTYVSAGVLAEGTSLAGCFTRSSYVKCRITVISQNASIEELDFLYTEYAGGFGDMNPITCTREITYDGQKAYIDLKVHTEHSGVWCQVADITAKTLGIGDVVQVNNLETTKIMIYDKLSPYKPYDPSDDEDESPIRKKLRRGSGGFDLYNLRDWAKHLYDGNRGEHWANYPASNDVQVGLWRMNFRGKANGKDYVTSFGSSGSDFVFAQNGNAFMHFAPYTNTDPNDPYAEHECQITEFLHPATSARDAADQYPGCWRIEVIFNKPMPIGLVTLNWRKELDKQFWFPISSTVVATDDTQMSYHCYIPEVYNDIGIGFWKVVCPVNQEKNRLFVRATISVVGSDGKFYKLTFPAGGGAVTATLDENQGTITP